MILFFKGSGKTLFTVGVAKKLLKKDINKLTWLFGNAEKLEKEKLGGTFIGPRKEMITPWSTNAVEITQNMGIKGITRIEEFRRAGSKPYWDPMLQSLYKNLDQDIFTTDRLPDPVKYIVDIGD